MNWPQNDYWLGNICDVSEAKPRSTCARPSSSASRCSTGCRPKRRAPDGGARLEGPAPARRIWWAREDGLAKYPYIRESRRIQAEFTVLEQHVGTDARTKLTGQARDDSRPSTSRIRSAWAATASTCTPRSGGDNYIDVSSLPFQIPLGALIPRRVENLLPACKNLGRHPHHQRLLPAASGGVEHRRIRGNCGSARAANQNDAAADPQ